MLQRSPTYVVSVPGRDPIARAAAPAAREDRVPARALEEHPVAMASYQLSRRPARRAARLHPQEHHQAAAATTIDVDTHFKPTYDPWDQRLCLVPDGDLFRALRHGAASIVTDTIETFTETGIRLDVGRGARGRHHRHRDRAEDAGRSAASSSPSTVSRGEDPADHGLQGPDAQRRAELRLHDRLHQRVLDAQGRPRRRTTSSGCCATSTSTATAGRAASATRTWASGRSWTSPSGYVLRALDEVPRAGRPGAVEAASRTTSPTSARSAATRSTTAS